MIEVRKMPGFAFDGVNLYVVFYNGVCKKVYSRNEKEAIEKVKAVIENEK